MNEEQPITSLPPNQSDRITPPEVKMNEGPTVEVKGKPEGATPLEPKVPETLAAAPVVAKGKKRKTVLDSIVGTISVMPFIDGTVENMGLENYNYAVYPGTYQVEQIAAIERNGVIRYITGLDEFAPEVQNLEEEKKAAVIHNIRFIVSRLEKELASNVIKLDDENFWDKVQLLKPNNHEFWSTVTIKVGNEELFLNPKSDAHDLIKMMAIEAGGFDLIAKSYEDAQAKARPPKWFLNKHVNTVATRTEYKKLKNKAIGLLDKLFGKDPKRLTYIAKVLDGNSTQYKNSTPQDVVYDNLDEYINARGVEGHKERAAQNFIDAVDYDMETLKLKAVVRDASFYKFVVTKADGMIYHNKQNVLMGRNVSDVVEFLRNPIHEDILKVLLEEVEHYWNQ